MADSHVKIKSWSPSGSLHLGQVEWLQVWSSGNHFKLGFHWSQTVPFKIFSRDSDSLAE